MQQHQDEVDRIAEVHDPECTERMSASVLDAEDENKEELNSQQYSGKPCSIKYTRNR